MSRHRKIDVRIYADAKFRQLSAPQPCGRYLWLYLLTGPHTLSIPGLFAAGEAALAEALGWPLDAWRAAWGEIAAQGMAHADWEGRLVWIPNAIIYNPPESPNVVRSWRVWWQELPECHLRDLAHAFLEGALSELGAAFVGAFAEACGKGRRKTSAKASRKASPKASAKASLKPQAGCKLSDRAPPSANQEQEQEQEQEQDNPPNPPGGASEEIPGELDTPEFRAKWAEWLAYRGQRKLPRYAPITLVKGFNKLKAMGVVAAIAAIEHSITQGWQSINEPKGATTAAAKPQTTAEQEVERVFRERGLS